jgi:hypothetical protein
MYNNKNKYDNVRDGMDHPGVTKKITDQTHLCLTVHDEKRQREQILAMNQVLARQVMEKSRMVAGQGKE